ncbi:MAG TPA: FecR domain-containing protein [Bacteroidales bacterium]
MGKKIPYQLLAKYFSGNCTEEEKLQIERWKAVNTSNEMIFQEYRDLWERSKKDESRFNPDVDEALNRIYTQLGMEGSATPVRVVSLSYYIKRVAAVLLIAVGLWLVYTELHQKFAVEPFVEVATLQGEKKMVVLPDSSHVWLNSQSKLKYEAKFVKKERKVILEGEAYFEVTRNRSKPFVIEAGNSLTTVLGTAFNLRARKGESVIEVTVTEGKVAFRGKEMVKQVKLLPGDKGILDLDKKQLELVKNRDPNFLAWKTGKLVFRNVPLSLVVSKLTDFYGRNIMVEDDSKADIPFTSTFDHKSLRDVLAIMEMSLGLKADTMNHIIVLK